VPFAEGSSFKKNGYYATYGFVHYIRWNARRDKSCCRKLKDNLRVIFLNTNVCYNKNLNLMTEIGDVGG